VGFGGKINIRIKLGFRRKQEAANKKKKVAQSLSLPVSLPHRVQSFFIDRFY
jgi:hypothetical protein